MEDGSTKTKGSRRMSKNVGIRKVRIEPSREPDKVNPLSGESTYLFEVLEQTKRKKPRVEMLLTSDELLQLSNLVLKELQRKPLPVEFSFPEEIPKVDNLASKNEELRSILIGIIDSLEKTSDTHGKLVATSFLPHTNRVLPSLHDIRNGNYSNVESIIRDFDHMLQAVEKSKPGDSLLYRDALRLREEFFYLLLEKFPQDKELIMELKKNPPVEGDNVEDSMDVEENITWPMVEDLSKKSPKKSSIERKKKENFALFPQKEETPPKRTPKKLKMKDDFFYYGSDFEEEATKIKDKKSRRGSKPR